MSVILSTMLAALIEPPGLGFSLVDVRRAGLRPGTPRQHAPCVRARTCLVYNHLHCTLVLLGITWRVGPPIFRRLV